MIEIETDWDLYRTFLAVASEGTLSGAARRLRLSQPTVSRHVEALEASLGATLFTRSQRGLALTAGAEELLPLAREMAAAATALKRASSGDAGAERGVVRLTSSPALAVSILPEILGDFMMTYPQIEVEFEGASEVVDLLRRDADIALRMVRPTQKALVARRLGSLELGLYAHRRYLERCGTPSVENLGRHRLIGFDRDYAAMHRVGPATEAILREWVGFRSDNLAAQLAVLRAGAGIGLCSRLLADHEPDLVRLMETPFKVQRDIWLVMHEDARSIRRVRLLYDHLAEQVGAKLRAGAS